jgi:hypothetical protein
LTAAPDDPPLALYLRFRDVRRSRPVDGEMMPYDWVSLPNPIGPMWLAYGLMVEEFARELANIVNEFTRHVRDLDAWAEVVTGLSDSEKLEAAISFINPVATVAVTLPAVIKSRFAFAAAHLCHQANQAKDSAWVDDFPLDEDIWPSTPDTYGKPWPAWRKLKPRLDALNSKAFQQATRDFRNTYNHRFSPRFVIGRTQMVTRRRAPSGQVSYAIGEQPPLDLKQIAGLLASERDRVYAAFRAFRALVTEQTSAIAAKPSV